MNIDALKLLYEVMNDGDPEILRGKLSEDCVYDARTISRTFSGPEAIIERCQFVKESRAKNPDTFYKTHYAITLSDDSSLEFGKGTPCLIPAIGAPDRFDSLIFVITDDSGLITKIISTEDQNYSFQIMNDEEHLIRVLKFDEGRPMQKFRTAFDAFNQNQCQDTYQAFVEAFREIVKTGQWVGFPTEDMDGKGVHATVIHEGKQYIVMFTREETVRLSNGMGIVYSDINLGINTIYNNPHCGGLAIDPFTEGSAMYVDLKRLEYFTGIPNPRTQQKDWGEGVPEYDENDLMVDEEMLDFGIEIVDKYLRESGYDILEETNALGQPCNIVARKDGELCFIKVKNEIVDIKTSLKGMDKLPTLTMEETEALLKFAKPHNGTPYFAPVSIGSSDPERMIKGIALYGDGYLVKFVGMEKV